MSWCVKTRNGKLWTHAVKTTRTAAISCALSVHRYDVGVQGVFRLDGWRWLRRTFGLSVVRVEIAEVLRSPGGLTDADRLAMAVLRGDTDAALLLADLVLETYYAGRKEGG
jgi:hypothetical protein